MTDPVQPDIMAKPFVSMFLLRPDARQIYQRGITTDGRANIFNLENSGSSPPVAPKGKFLATGDNNNQFYLFSVDGGALIWAETIGSLLGSSTLPQFPDRNNEISEIMKSLYFKSYLPKFALSNQCLPLTGNPYEQTIIPSIFYHPDM
jgi:hypothetical protein